MKENDIEQICKTIIDSLSQEKISRWIQEALQYVNQEGKEFWRLFALEYTSSSRTDYDVLDNNVIETALGLKDERARIALSLLNNSDKITKIKANRFKEKVQLLQEDHSDLTTKFKQKYKFKFMDKVGSVFKNK